MAWEDRTPFDAIEKSFGLSESQVIQLMRHELKRSSFELWRKRVTGRVTMSIGTISFEALRMTLIQWAKSGFPNATPIYSVAITPPATCSDGVTRSLSDYVPFVTGKTMTELIAPLQARCPEFVVSFATTGPEILVVISRA